MSFGSWLAHTARDNALVSPWAQGNLAYSDAAGAGGAHGGQENPNPANRPGFYSGTKGAAPTPGGGNTYTPTPPVSGPSSEARSGPGHFGVTPPASTPTATPAPAYGSQSGPGILENWFNQRAAGTDPAYEYAMKRGGDEIDNRMAAGGSFNSGARGQQLSDFGANMGAQRMGQLDALAGGASGEHQNRLNSMFSQGLGLAGGQSSINSAYDLAAGRAQSDALSALLGYTTNKAGVDSASNQAGVNNLFKLGALAA